jgi:hypothetical protein
MDGLVTDLGGGALSDQAAYSDFPEGRPFAGKL